jgi:two-component system alkaline phosphatase synthesis response regulator PhoP
MSPAAKQILVVEDNVALASVVRFNLERAGFQVRVVANGKEGWRLLQEEPFDLAMIDHQMPEMNGTDLCRLIRGDGRIANLPVVMLTAKKFELDNDFLRKELGVREIISKPFSPRALTRIVEECLSGDAVAN